ncbi:MAG TPA: protein translocase subunit SecF [Actinomycetota bacterium]|nr:protein translocase subunit SecF [Actinomycetota bacterium]
MNLAHAFDVFRGYRTPRFPIVQHRRWWALLSGAAVTLALLGLFVRGLNYSIDFRGGTQIQYENRSGADVEAIRDVLAQDPYRREEAEVLIVGGNRVQIRTSALTDLTQEERTNLIDALAAQAGVEPSDISTQVVGPTWGEQISRQAIIGLVIVLAAIAVYITFRFEWKMAIGALAAMIHDVLITAGVYALTGRQVSPATVIAILTILGFSLYDTVVIYDKVQENTESSTLLAKDTYEGVANLSMNQVLMRSVNTSLVVVLPIASLLLFGGQTLKDFAFAMLIGTITGAYSSIFVATPILVVLKEREQRFQQHRARLEARPRAERRLRAVPAPEREAQAEATEEAKVGARATPNPSARRAGQRPRPKSRRKPPAKRKRR